MSGGGSRWLTLADPVLGQSSSNKFAASLNSSLHQRAFLFPKGNRSKITEFGQQGVWKLTTGSCLRTQLESIVLSDFGELVTSEIPGINLFKAYTQSKIIFLFLDSRRYGETAKALGRFILQDLKSVSARVDGEVPKEQ